MSAPASAGGLPREARGAEIEARLRTALQPQSLEVVDDSHKHSVRVVAEAFSGLRPIARHRLIYEALGTLMATDIHALAIEARAPGEAAP